MTQKNVSASVKQRLLNISRKTGEDFQLLFTRYAVERLLLRLSVSGHRESFVLKGAMLFALWTGEMHRPTRDLDLLGFGDPSGEQLKTIFAELCGVAVAEDGLEFDAASVCVEPIREDQEYGGQRVKLKVRLGQARIDLQVDVGYGDAITPKAEDVEYPTLLGMEPPRLRAYPKETVVAEKLEALVTLGLANSRMKDFYDLLVIARTFTFDGELLRDAITKTFARRGTELPSGSGSRRAHHAGLWFSSVLLPPSPRSPPPQKHNKSNRILTYWDRLVQSQYTRRSFPRAFARRAVRPFGATQRG